MDGARLEAIGLCKSYGDREVLRDVSFSVTPGTVLAIIGPNGAGKSTLVRLVTGIEPPDRGRVSLDGVPVSSYSRRQLARRMAVLPQTPLVAGGFSVYDTVMMGRHPHLRPWRGETNHDRQVVERILWETGLNDLAGVTVNHLSGGQRQIVALAMVLAQEPDVLILDEPTTFLDIGHQMQILNLVCGGTAGRGREGRRPAVILVLHDLNLAALYAHRTLLLRAGSTEAYGSPAEVLTEDHIESVYGIRPRVLRHPDAGVPQILLPAPPWSALGVQGWSSAGGRGGAQWATTPDAMPGGNRKERMSCNS
ncbi:ABC transporter ATP-binding protein [Kyrpidia sp.]|uniref:ABC transporter ATP-binding protein n=1 Tax=Kyrpidia sp. TaxID=2073077 RepID=UPI00258A7B30|nr:ABC transporter ATP-binding protein [Kyrpidia sp.]MCL6574819.1 ABC transporter ATP-binding protein [Kyrpidia sp.]